MLDASAAAKASEQEQLESNSRICWNRFTRLLDKFIELIFVLSLVTVAIGNQVFCFIGAPSGTANTGFHPRTLLVSFYQLFLALLIFLSWRGNTKILTYFGFMRGSLTKAIFLLFAAAMVSPGKYAAARQNGVEWLKWYQYAVAWGLSAAAVPQILKVCNKKSEGEGERSASLNFD